MCPPLKNISTNLEIPSIPKEIIDAIDRGRLIVFVGAGVSRLFDLPSWDNLARAMIDFAFEDKSDGKRMLSFSAKQQLLSKNYSGKKLLSILFEMYHNNKSAFLKKMCSELNIDLNKDTPGKRIIKRLIEWNSSIITTNYDMLIENMCNDNYRSFNSCSDFNIPEDNIYSSFILHIHGSVESPNDMVFSAAQYFELYRNEHTQQILNMIFNGEYTILFIGYGLDEYELIDYIQRSKQKNAFFTLVPYTNSDAVLERLIADYYAGINVMQIPYYIDEDGYGALADVIDNWAKDFYLRTKLLTNKTNKIDRLISQKPNLDAIKEMRILLSGHHEYVHFLKKIEKSAYAVEWVIKLQDCEFFNGDWIVNRAKNDIDVLPVLSLDVLNRLLKLNYENNELKTIAKNIVATISNTQIDNALTSMECNIHRICEEMTVLLLDEFDPSIIGYLEAISLKLDTDLSNIINPLIDNLNSFFKMKSKNRLLLIELIIKLICVEHTRVNNYYFGKLYNNVIIYIPQNIQSELYAPMLSGIEKIIDSNLWYCPDMGSVSEYISSEHTDERLSYLVKWFCLIIGSLSGKSLLDFINRYLTSKYHLLNTLALHAINIRFDDSKSLFWNLSTYDDLNYSELYDLVKNNIQKFSDNEIEHYIQCVNNSTFTHGKDYLDLTKTYRYDLFKLLPSEKAYPFLLENHVENSAFTEIQNRGKLIWSTGFQWRNEVKNQHQFKDIYELIETVDKNGSIFQFAEVEQYLSNNVEELIDNLDICSKLPICYYPIVYSVIEKISQYDDRIFNFYKMSAIMILKNDYHALGTLINSFGSWITECNAETKSSMDFLIELAKSECNRYINEPQEIRDDYFIASFTNWYVSILWALLQKFEYSNVKSEISIIMKLLESIITSDISENRILVKILIAYNFGYIYRLDEKWMKTYYRAILTEDNSLEPVTTFISSNNYYDHEAYQYLVDSQILKNLLINYHQVTSSGNHDTLRILAIKLTYAYLHDDILKYSSLLRTGIKLDQDFLCGILSQLSYEEKNNTDANKIRSLLDIIIRNFPKDLESSDIQHDLVNYLSSSKTHTKKNIKLVKVITSSNMKYLTEEFVRYLLDHVDGMRDEICDIVLNLVNNTSDYYPKLMDELVLNLINLKANSDTLKMICNIMINKGYDQYSELIRRIN